jgi:hypothetical protein
MFAVAATFKGDGFKGRPDLTVDFSRISSVPRFNTIITTTQFNSGYLFQKTLKLIRKIHFLEIFREILIIY